MHDLNCFVGNFCFKTFIYTCIVVFLFIAMISIIVIFMQQVYLFWISVLLAEPLWQIFLTGAGGGQGHFFTNLRWKRHAAPHILSVLKLKILFHPRSKLVLINEYKGILGTFSVIWIIPTSHVGFVSSSLSEVFMIFKKSPEVEYYID